MTGLILLIKYALLYGVVLLLVAMGGMWSEHSGIIVYLCAFSMIFKGFFSKLIGGALFKKRGGDQS